MNGRYQYNVSFLWIVIWFTLSISDHIFVCPLYDFYNVVVGVYDLNNIQIQEKKHCGVLSWRVMIFVLLDN